ncbi:MAG: NAD(P)/FAD-dependent oxidoreductase [Chitinivibrionia bacterium]|nr:NAD(P)/FAD-dependent oxidoreductase [Chitinivibrionia bacterium]
MKNVVVIGSGIGGLTAGAFLAQAGMKVVVVEQHDRIGGYAHNFYRKNYCFESGIHTVPFGDNGVLRKILGQLNINDQIKTFQFPEMYRTISPYGTDIMPEAKSDILAKLYGDYSHQKKGLDRFFGDLDLLYDAILTHFDKGKRGLLDEKHSAVAPFLGHSYGSYLEELFDDEKLRFFLSGMWMYVGAPSGYAQHLFLQMLFNAHFHDGSHGIVGGFAAVAKTLAKFIEDRGGKIILKDSIESIICEDKAAKSVKTAKGLSIDCDLVLSGSSPYLLHNKLLSEDNRLKFTQKRLARLNPADSVVIAYLGMKKGYEKYINSNVAFYFKNKDINAPYRRIHSNPKLPFDCDNLAILHSVEFIADPTILLFSFVKQSDSQNWKVDKKIIAQKMIEELNVAYPGIKEYIDFVETGSPNTFERYTLNTGGSIYGFENIADIYAEAKMPIKTHIKNIYQVGHWTRPGCGMLNTVLSGYTAAQVVLEDM